MVRESGMSGGWPPAADKMAEKWPRRTAAQNRVGPVLAFVGPLVGVWWLPMMVEVLGSGKGSRWWLWVVKQWPKNGWEVGLNQA